MANPLENLPVVPGTTAGTGPVAPVAPSNAPGEAGKVSPVANARATIAAHGGNPGGKPHFSGHPPGSAEAIAAEKERDAKRKRDERADKRAKNPPVLQPTLSGAARATPPPSGVAGAGVVGGGPAPLPVIPWTAELLAPLAAQMIPACEQVCVKRLTSKAAQAKLTAAVLKQIEADARWSPATNAALNQSVPRLAAKYLNRSGVSAEYQDELTFGFALVAIVRGQSSLESKLDKLIALQESPTATPPPKATP